MSSFFSDFYAKLFASSSIIHGQEMLVIHSSVARYITWVIAFLIIMPLSWRLWRKGISTTFAPGFFFASFLIPSLIVPGIASESIIVGPDVIRINTGFWFQPEKVVVSLSDLQAVYEGGEVIPQRGLARKDLFWHFHYRDGGRRDLHLSDLFWANRSPVADYLTEHGVAFHRE